MKSLSALSLVCLMVGGMWGQDWKFVRSGNSVPCGANCIMPIEVGDVSMSVSCTSCTVPLLNSIVVNLCRKKYCEWVINPGLNVAFATQNDYFYPSSPHLPIPKELR